MTLRVGSLFTGIGGIDLGFQKAGFPLAYQVERDPSCQSLLKRHFGVPLYDDIRTAVPVLPPTEIVAGGDPCPAHSVATGGRPAAHPDLSGWFLAAVLAAMPHWVVRENVRASTVDDFAMALELLGYQTVVVDVDAVAFTAQSRGRTIVVGSLELSRDQLARMFHECEPGQKRGPSPLGARQVVACLTTHRNRYGSQDNYVFEGGRLRILDSEERERFAGFPIGWTAGFSPAARARMLGNSALPQWFEWIGHKIKQVEERAQDN